MPLRALRTALRRKASPKRAAVSRTFFKTGPGQYGEGDVFIGLTVPDLRALAKESRDLPEKDVTALLRSKIHEERLVALLLLVDRFQRGDGPARKRVFDLYRRNFDRVNNWDLVDLSAPPIAGAYLADRSRAPLATWARSRVLWERRIAIVSTLYFIRHGDFGDTLRISRMLLDDPEDLMHKAVGWMLREVGKRDRRVLETFLRQHLRRMPRTALRYAIERFPERLRKAYLRGTA